MRRVPLALASLLLVGGVVHARFARVETEDVPIERLIANLEKAGESSTLARVHAMAYATRAETACVRSGTNDPFHGHVPRAIPWALTVKTDEAKADAARKHLSRAIELYRGVLKADGKDRLATIGLAWCLLQTKEAKDRDEAKKLLRPVFDETLAEDLKRGRAFGHLLSEEVGGYLLEALDAESDAKEVEDVKARMAPLAKLGRMVTPIAIPLERVDLDEVLDPAAAVRFDVDGAERRGRWSWITPRAGWLVALPRDGSRAVRSGLQLFGNVTWWVFWRDGYEALAALDDDRDGSLRGAELRGLGVWCDRDGDGRSDPGEVRTLEEAGIVALSCAGEDPARPTVARWSPRGVTFASGEVRPTWDVLLAYAPR